MERYLESAERRGLPPLSSPSDVGAGLQAARALDFRRLRFSHIEEMQLYRSYDF
jgi:hypothetical protein